MNLNKIDYLCPMCGSLLQLENNLFACNKCLLQFEVKEDIPIFRKKDYHFTSFSDETITMIMQTNNWIEALKEILEHYPRNSRREWLRNITSDSQTGWIPLLSIPENKGVALDFGCGWGNISLNLAKYYETVVCYDLTYERLNLLKKRAHDMGVNNLILICGGDTPKLPFPEGYFDTVVLQGVLEWIPTSQEGNPKKIQFETLREINRALKKTGQIYIGIENRIGYEYFLGLPDNHSQLLYSSLLPRIVANWYSLIRSGTDYRTYTYTMQEHKRLLEKSGYKKTHFYSLSPTYREFNQVVDISSDDKMQFEPTIYVKSNIKRFFLKSPLYKYFAPCFGIVASKDNAYPSFIDSLLASISEQLSTKISIEKYLLSEKGVIILKVSSIDRGNMIVKIPLNTIADTHCNSNYENIRLFSQDKNIPIELKGYVPKPIFSGKYKNVHYFVEERIEGINGNRIEATLINKIFEQVNMFITKIHLSTINRTIIDEETYNKLVGKYIIIIQTMFEDNAQKQILEKIEIYLKARLLGKELPVVWRKGDCSFNNIIVGSNNKELMGVIDWDLSMREGLPFLDLLTLLSGKNRVFKLGELFINVLFKKNFQEYEEDIIENYFKAIQLPKEFFEPLCILFWINHVCAQNDYYIRFNEIWMEENFFNVLKYLELELK